MHAYFGEDARTADAVFVVDPDYRIARWDTRAGSLSIGSHGEKPRSLSTADLGAHSQLEALTKARKLGILTG